LVDDVSVVYLDRLSLEVFYVVKIGFTAIGRGLVIFDTGAGMEKRIVRTQVKMEYLRKSRERNSKRVVVA